MNYEQLMKTARATNKKRDELDRHHGFLPPSEGDLYPRLETVMSAIEAGITSNDWRCIAEAQAMLEDIKKTLEGAMKARGLQ